MIPLASMYSVEIFVEQIGFNVQHEVIMAIKITLNIYKLPLDNCGVVDYRYRGDKRYFLI